MPHKLLIALIISSSLTLACSNPSPTHPTATVETKAQIATLHALALKHRGRFADDSGLWAEPAVRERLTSVLGPNLRTFFGSVELKQPTGFVNGILYVLGSNRRDRTYAAAFALDTATGEVYVRLRERGEDSSYPAPYPSFKLPGAVQAYMSAWRIWPESLALARGHAQISDRPVARDPQVPRVLVDVVSSHSLASH